MKTTSANDRFFRVPCKGKWKKTKAAVTAICPRCGNERTNIGNGKAVYRCTPECEKSLIIECVNPKMPEPTYSDKQAIRWIGEQPGLVEEKYYRPASISHRATVRANG